MKCPECGSMNRQVNRPDVCANCSLHFDATPTPGHRAKPGFCAACGEADPYCACETRPAQEGRALLLLRRYREAHRLMALTAADADAAREYRAITREVDEYLEGTRNEPA